MVIKISDKWKKLLFSVILLYIGIRVGTPDEFIFLCALFVVLMLIINYKRLIIPQIMGFKIYSISILIMLVYGLFSGEVNHYAKGAFHVLSVVVMVILGYYLSVMTSHKKSLFLSMEICGIIISLISIVRGLRNFGELTTIEGLRKYFGADIYELTTIFVVLLFICVFKKKVIATRAIDIFALVLLGLNILISLGRAQIFAILIVLVVMSISNFVFEKNKIKVLGRFLAVVIVLATLIGTVLYFLPYDVQDTFFDKTVNSSKEINYESEFRNDSEIFNNWRGYEIKNATRQWKHYNALEMLIGGGIQKQIKIINLPSYFSSSKGYSFENSQSPILHNGYYTLLVKGGLLGLVGLIIWLLAPIFMLAKNNNEEQRDILLLMICLNAMYLIFTYVVRGVIDQVMHISYGLTIGWLNGLYFNSELKGKFYE